VLDAVVIGAGHAGLAASQRLADAGLDHVVLERGAIGESWRSQRWDSFALNTPNRMNRLPGAAADDADPDGFEARDAWVARLGRYARQHGLPVRERTTVRAVESDGDVFTISTDTGSSLRAHNVIVASGMVNAPKIPAAAGSIDPRIDRLTAGTYRAAGSLRPGAVLVVGSAQSGCQIAEDLRDAGREVYLATGKVGRLRRRMRGRDSIVWLSESGWLEQRPADLRDPAMVRLPQAQISGVGPRGRTVSLQALAASGITLLGRFTGAAGTRARFAPDLPEHVRFADQLAGQMRMHVDDHIARAGIAAPPSEHDAADTPVSDPATFTAPLELDLADRDITTVIFTTGFTGDLSWLRVPAVDPSGAPIHDEGRSPVAGLWFLGWSWMRKRKSGIIWGADEDSAHIVRQVAARATGVAPRA